MFWTLLYYRSRFDSMYYINLLECHFHVEPDELGQMSVRIGIFGAEDGTSSENFVKISSNRHLFVQLRRLSKVRVTEHELESSRKIEKYVLK